MPEPSELSAKIVEFCRLLRSHGFRVGPAEEADALRALLRIDLGNNEEFRLSLRTVLCSSHKEQKIFDLLYWPFWEQGRTISVSVQDEAGMLKGKQTTVTSPLLSWSRMRESPQQTTGGYSPMETAARKELKDLSEHDAIEAARLVRALSRLLRSRPGRRYRSSQKRRLLDFRKTLRLSLRSGEVLDLAFRQRAPRPLKLVVLCDVSGSMDSYSRFLLSFLYALQQFYSGVETFVFSTALRRVTNLLKSETPAKALQKISDAVPEWSGGTRIGQSLQTFVQQYGSRLMTNDTLLLIFSDGWDVGEIDVLEQCLKTMRQRTFRLIWLNPLLESTGFEPTCSGLQAALPYLDALLPAQNLASLWKLYHFLSSHRRKRSLERTA